MNLARRGLVFLILIGYSSFFWSFTAAYIACKGDPIANLQEDLAAEQKARATYEKLWKLKLI